MPAQCCSHASPWPLQCTCQLQGWEGPGLGGGVTTPNPGLPQQRYGPPSLSPHLRLQPTSEKSWPLAGMNPSPQLPRVCMNLGSHPLTLGIRHTVVRRPHQHPLQLLVAVACRALRLALRNYGLVIGSNTDHAVVRVLLLAAVILRVGLSTVGRRLGPTSGQDPGARARLLHHRGHYPARPPRGAQEASESNRGLPRSPQVPCLARPGEVATETTRGRRSARLGSVGAGAHRAAQRSPRPPRARARKSLCRSGVHGG